MMAGSAGLWLGEVSINSTKGGGGGEGGSKGGGGKKDRVHPFLGRGRTDARRRWQLVPEPEGPGTVSGKKGVDTSI